MAGASTPILDWPDNALATTSTHDLPTLNGWWHSRDIDWNVQLGLIMRPPWSNGAGTARVSARHCAGPWRKTRRISR